MSKCDPKGGPKCPLLPKGVGGPSSRLLYHFGNKVETQTQGEVEDLAIKASAIWTNTPDELTITFTEGDLEEFRFPDMGNASEWLELGDIEHVWHKGGAVVSDEEARAMGAGDLAAR